MALEIKVVETKTCAFTVSLRGSLDSTTYGALQKKIDYLIQEGKAKVITLDLQELAFISSMGVRVLIKARKDLRPNGGSLCLLHIPPPIRKVFEIIDALPSMQVFASIEEMDAYLAAMQRPAGS